MQRTVLREGGEGASLHGVQGPPVLDTVLSRPFAIVEAQYTTGRTWLHIARLHPKNVWFVRTVSWGCNSASSRRVPQNVQQWCRTRALTAAACTMRDRRSCCWHNSCKPQCLLHWVSSNGQCTSLGSNANACSARLELEISLQYEVQFGNYASGKSGEAEHPQMQEAS